MVLKLSVRAVYSQIDFSNRVGATSTDHECAFMISKYQAMACAVGICETINITAREKNAFLSDMKPKHDVKSITTIL